MSHVDVTLVTPVERLSVTVAVTPKPFASSLFMDNPFPPFFNLLFVWYFGARVLFSSLVQSFYRFILLLFFLFFPFTRNRSGKLSRWYNSPLRLHCTGYPYLIIAYTITSSSP